MTSAQNFNRIPRILEPFVLSAVGEALLNQNQQNPRDITHLRLRGDVMPLSNNTSVTSSLARSCYINSHKLLVVYVPVACSLPWSREEE